MEEEARLRAQLQEKDERIELLAESLRQAELEIAARDSRLEEAQQVLNQMGRSIEWKLANRITRLARLIAPPGTRRRQLLRRGFRELRALPTLAQRLNLPARVRRLRDSFRTMPTVSGPRDLGILRQADRRQVRLDAEHRRLDHHSTALSETSTPSPASGNVLIIDHRLPSPDRDCGSLRMVEIIRAILAHGLHVSFVPDNFLLWPPYFQDLQSMGVEVVLPPAHHSVAEYLREHGHKFHLAIISRAGIAAKHMTTVRRLAPNARLVFDTVDLHFLREERQAELTQDSAQRSAASSRRGQELRLAAQADLTVVVSPIEKQVIEEECPGIEVMTIPTIYPVEPTEPPGFDERKDIVFIGGFAHAPNVDAVLYFAHEILPRIHARLPGAVFKVIGPEPTPEISSLESPHIQVLGYVSDVKPIFDRARVSVAPLRFGAGVKGKVNHSMALGVPSVITPLAAEGMYLEHEHNVMIAEDPQGFADAVIRVWETRDLWERLSRNGLSNLRDHFSVEAARQPIDELLAWAGLCRPAPSHPVRAATGG